MTPCKKDIITKALRKAKRVTSQGHHPAQEGISEEEGEAEDRVTEKTSAEVAAAAAAADEATKRIVVFEIGK